MAKFFARSLNPVWSCLFTQTRSIFYAPLGSTLKFTASICYILGHYGHAQSYGGRQSAVPNSPLYGLLVSLTRRAMGDSNTRLLFVLDLRRNP